MEKRLYVIGMGELLWDMLPDGKQLGGAPANFAYHAQQMGAKGAILSAVGNDPLGDEICENIEKLNIDSLISRVDYPTGTVAVKLSSNGIPTYNIVEDVAWDMITLSDHAKNELNKADAICFGSLAQRNEVSRNEIEKAINYTSDKCLKVFDINLRQHFYTKEVIVKSLVLCNVLKINDEELDILSAMFGWEGSDIEKCQFLIDHYKLEMLALTCGEKGSYLFTINEQSFLETPKVEVADTVGAGDSFTGVMIIGKLQNKPLSEIHQMAVNVSAFVCTKKGATPSYALDKICDKINC
ncbi:carbohydrate kinase family protein [Plebeiibacterium sediminum]|uniref:Carbohydrate kinase n=1 Tax=Plebeiibacterium sediminum TaxID=2992112 RepID=A0AAE3SGA3_9BACT|nr:carbohydrate kinase [Plebeiobacterium sediminum]MCW3788295.1 carbohydrate kinase [Plebeiobacterium sediminum]